jgi:hypothetical protein
MYRDLPEIHFETNALVNALIITPARAMNAAVIVASTSMTTPSSKFFAFWLFADFFQVARLRGISFLDVVAEQF